MSYTKEQALTDTLAYFNGNELQASTVVNKYLLRNKQGEFLESSPDQMHKRLTAEFARIEQKYPNALEAVEIFEQLDGFKYIIPQGSPQYGIGNNQSLVSLSNCVVVDSPEDDISSIINSGKDLANLFKRRCGVGLDISKLRPDGMSVSNSAGTTTGAWSFADFYSYVCNMIGQNGRRGALMITLDVRHPDVIKFATCKQELTKVTGANISVKITDDFMNAVNNDEDYQLHWPVGSANPVFTQVVKAREIWKTIVKSATKTADPGLMMWDNILRTLPAECYADVGFKHLTTNPCGEIPLSAYDSCRLIAILLSNYVVNAYTTEAYFDYNRFGKAVRVAMRLSDDLIDLEIEKLTAIIAKVDTADEKTLWTKMLEACVNGRRTGLGTTGLADTFSRLGIIYGSQESIDVADQIYKTLKIEAYSESAELAKQRGPFPIFDWEKEKDNEFIQSLPEDLKQELSKYGRRNISILTNAPTGSVSIEAGSSSGIEPVFRIKHMRRKKVNHSDVDVKVDFVDEVGNKWQEFQVLHPEVLKYFEVTGKNQSTQLPAYFISSDQIDWESRVRLQATIQKHIDHSISSTINLPSDTSPETVSALYMLAWRLGLKGVTVYVEGSKSGVLVSQEQQSKQAKTTIQYGEAPKRPAVLPAVIEQRSVKGENWQIIIGLLDGKPYEVFVAPATQFQIPERYIKVGKGEMIKVARKTMPSKYLLKFDDDTQINVLDSFKDANDFATLSRFISMSLRHGVPIQFVVDQLQKEPNDELGSFNRVLARVLKHWIPDGTKREKPCEHCKSVGGLVYQEGCLTCQNCGFAKCG